MFLAATTHTVFRPHPQVQHHTQLDRALIGAYLVPMVSIAQICSRDLYDYFGDTETSLLLVRHRLCWRLFLCCLLQDTVASLSAILITAATVIGTGHYVASVCLATLGHF